MSYQNINQRKSKFPVIPILFVVIIALVIISGISLNKIRNGQPGFISNLWVAPPKNTNDPILTGKPDALNVPNNVKTILFLGSDFTPQTGYRTDVILLASFNMTTGKVNLFSFPRDLWVTIPGWEDQRINTAQPHGGNQMLSDTLAYNFGFRPDHFAMVDFQGFKHIIEVMGGLDVTVTKRMEDACDLTPEKWCVVDPGVVHMDPDFALWYVRARKNSSDFDRGRRAQEVIQAMAKKAISPANLGNLPGLLMAINDTVETDMKVSDMWPYALPLVKYLKPDLVNTYRLTPTEAVPFTTDMGASVLRPDVPAIQAILKQVLWMQP